MRYGLNFSPSHGGENRARSRDPRVLCRVPRVPAMQREEADYPAQSAARYLQRVAKCTMLLLCTSPLVFGSLLHILRLAGVDHDKVWRVTVSGRGWGARHQRLLRPRGVWCRDALVPPGDVAMFGVFYPSRSELVALWMCGGRPAP